MVIQGLALEVLVHWGRWDEAFSLSFAVGWCRSAGFEVTTQAWWGWTHGDRLLFFVAGQQNWVLKCVWKREKEQLRRGLVRGHVPIQSFPRGFDIAACVFVHFQQLSQLDFYQNIATVLLTDARNNKQGTDKESKFLTETQNHMCSVETDEISDHNSI